MPRPTGHRRQPRRLSGHSSGSSRPPRLLTWLAGLRRGQRQAGVPEAYRRCESSDIIDWYRLRRSARLGTDSRWRPLRSLVPIGTELVQSAQAWVLFVLSVIAPVCHLLRAVGSPHAVHTRRLRPGLRHSGGRSVGAWWCASRPGKTGSGKGEVSSRSTRALRIPSGPPGGEAGGFIQQSTADSETVGRRA